MIAKRWLGNVAGSWDQGDQWRHGASETTRPALLAGCVDSVLVVFNRPDASSELS